MSRTDAEASGEEMAVKAVSKRYESLLTLRMKAVKGKGAWYWAHLEPVIVINPETNLPKTVKLKCTLCDAVFSSSNPSRTASEHLKKGTCPNFTSVLSPVSQLPPLTSPSSLNNFKKRPHQLLIGGTSSNSYQVGTIEEISQTPRSDIQQHLVLSGGKEDLEALAMLEDSVKKIKRSKESPGPSLRKEQVDSAVNLLSDWFYESCGSVSFSSLDHPTFKAFLNQVGLPSISQTEFLGHRLDSKFENARINAETRIKEAEFFQLASNGWEFESFRHGEERAVKCLINLPNGDIVFHNVDCIGNTNTNTMPTQYVKDFLWETMKSVSGNDVRKCVGIVSDKYKNKALKELETQHNWMVNLSCLIQGFVSLVKDFSKDLPLFQNVIDSCLKIAAFFNNKSQIRHIILKLRLQEFEAPGLIRVPHTSKNLDSITRMMEDVLSYARVLRLVVSDDSLYLEHSSDRDIVDIIKDVGFWNNLEAVHSLVQMITKMAEDIENDRPLVGDCLPLWQELRNKVKGWCCRFNIIEGPIEQIFEKRFKKNYHPSWSSAFILDPQHLLQNESGQYLPPFKFLTKDQEKDVENLILRLVPKEEAKSAVMDLMKWRSEGLDPLYAKAVQVKKRDPITGKMKVVNPLSSRLVWETCLKDFKTLGKVALRLLFMQATTFSSSCVFKCSFSNLRCVSSGGGQGLDMVQKMIYVAANSKLERRDFSSIEEKDREFLSDEKQMNVNLVP